MNNVRSAMLTLIRNYSKHTRGMQGVKSKLKLAEITECEVDIDEMDPEDMDEGISDFKDLDQSYKQYTREQKMEKLKLKQRIVADKYFKEVQPSFLTSIEKNEIRKLHEDDPKEWTVERLSESFPALPDVIRKILRTNWQPMSVDRVLKYDEQVVSNWKKFKSDKLALDPELKEHLMKFKNRQISMTDRDVLVKQLVPPKVELPKPKSTMFSRLVQGYIGDEKSNTQKLISSTNNESINRKGITTHKENIMIGQRTISKECDRIEIPVAWTSSSENMNVDMQHVSMLNEFDKDENNETFIACTKTNEDRSADMSGIPTFNEYVKDKLEKLYEGSPEKAVGLLREYDRYVKSLKSKNRNFDVNKDSAETNKELAKPSEFEEEIALSNPDLRNDSLDINTDSQESNTLREQQQMSTAAALSMINNHYNPRPKKEQRFTFTEFVKAKLDTVMKESPEEGMVLLQTFRQQKEEEKLQNESIELSNDSVGMQNNDITIANMTTNEDTLAIVEQGNKSVATSESNLLSRSLETFVKEWKKKMETNFNYAGRLKIPRNLYKFGKTYRVKDCYYDHDGEFLFRIPGVRS